MSNPLYFSFDPGGQSVSAAHPLPVADASARSTVAPGAAPTYATTIAVKYDASGIARTDGQTGSVWGNGYGAIRFEQVYGNTVIDPTLPVSTTGVIATVSGTKTRPNDTTAYAVGDAIAESTTAGSCTPITLAVSRIANATGMIRRLRLKVNDTAWLNATVRCHFYKSSPTYAAGDNAAWSTTESNYIGAMDVLLERQFSDPFVKGIGVPITGSEMSFEPDVGTTSLYVVLETRTAVTPAASKVFTLTAEVLQN